MCSLFFSNIFLFVGQNMDVYIFKYTSVVKSKLLMNFTLKIFENVSSIVLL